MSAKDISGQTPGGKRAKLADQLPLATPYLIQIFPVYACNFKCNYCIFSVPKSQRGYLSEQKLMDIDLYHKCIDDMAEYPEKVRMLRFAGTGEPLLHPQIADMIQYASNAAIADSIDIVTNGALLKKDLSEKLVNSGVNRIRVSIQGVTSKKYKEVTGTYSNLDEIVSNISYLYSIREKTEIYVKIIDSALESDTDKEAFKKIFSSISDIISVETTIPATHLIDYTLLIKEGSLGKTQNRVDILEAEVCPQPFYMMQINPDGNVVPCCAMDSPIKCGNCASDNITSIWSGNTLNHFRRRLLAFNRKHIPVCNQCEQFRHSMFPDDYLDSNAERLLEVFKEK